MDWNAKTAQVCWSPRMYWCSENPRPSEASTTASSPAAPLWFVNMWWMESLWCYRDEVGFLLAGQEWNNLFGTGSFTTSVFGNVLKEQTSQRSSWHTTASKGVRRVLRCVGFSWFNYMFPHIFYIIQLLTLQGSSLRLHDFTIQGPNHNPRDSWELEGQVLLAWCPLRTSRPLVIEWVGSICELRMFLQWVWATCVEAWGILHCYDRGGDSREAGRCCLAEVWSILAFPNAWVYNVQQLQYDTRQVSW